MCKKEYIYFGTYPQTKVTDTTTINALKSLAGALPTASDKQKWTSYKYYIESSNTTDYMWYMDIEYNGNKYRGVYFSSYRTFCVEDLSENLWDCAKEYALRQKNHGYYINTLYWFLYEPIKWRTLKKGFGFATILSELIIDSQHYYHDCYLRTKTRNDNLVYANNYAESEIREWLNDTFYNTAFNTLQKELIQTVNVDNSARSTNPNNDSRHYGFGKNEHVCSNTNDKIWLLSKREVTKASYGFSASLESSNTRKKQSTDYAQSQGSETCWWLRSPDYFRSYYAQVVNNDGYSDDCNRSVDFTDCGIVPALKIKLS